MKKELIFLGPPACGKGTQTNRLSEYLGFPHVDTGSLLRAEIAKGKKVTLVGFGTWEARKRAARTGRNPQTGKELKIAAKTVPAFSAGKNFKELVK